MGVQGCSNMEKKELTAFRSTIALREKPPPWGRKGRTRRRMGYLGGKSGVGEAILHSGHYIPKRDYR